ncbi:MAG: hypothetical protein V1697_01735 [Candidatus Levyibacteriota bacterium]
MKIKFKEKYLERIIILLMILFSAWLMFSTFSYEKGSMFIATKAWSDFASHIPLIRSFSLGNNFPPEYPIFPGSPIRYHFLFYAFVGFFEKAGLRIDFALNLLSSASFFLLLFSIYKLSKLLFKSIFVSTISVLLFLFNGSFAFFYFFNKNPLSFPKSIFDILNNQIFPAFAPYDKTLISGGFWNLNVFTNQRHFALPLALFLFIVYVLIKSEKDSKKLPLKLAILFGFVIGLFSFLHGAVFIMSLVVLSTFFILFPKQRMSIFLILIISFLTSLPRILFLLQSGSGNVLKLNPGYLAAGNFSIYNWFRYWMLNLGLGTALIPLGFLLSKKLHKKIFIGFFSLFIIGNIFQFSPDIAANHKFFNLFIIIANIFIALVLYKVWKKKFYGKIITIVLIFFLTFSGVIDFFAIKNDPIGPIPDYPINPDISWIIKNTPKDAVFINSTYIYNPASLAGRKIFMGWPYFSWSLGYDTTKRDYILREFFVSNDLNKNCKILKENNISYIISQDNSEFVINKEFMDKNYLNLYENKKSTVIIYEAKNACNF